MKKERAKGFLLGAATTIVSCSLVISAAATIGSRNLTADYNDIKITLNGQPVAPTDANGNPVEPFAINGTTYLPVRAVSNALGLDVEWNGSTNTVILDKNSSSEVLYSQMLAVMNEHKIMEDRCDDGLLRLHNLRGLLRNDDAEYLEKWNDGVASYEQFLAEDISAAESLMKECDDPYLTDNIQVVLDGYKKLTALFGDLHKAYNYGLLYSATGSSDSLASYEDLCLRLLNDFYAVKSTTKYNEIRDTLNEMFEAQ